MGLGDGEVQEARCFNRVLSWFNTEVPYKADAKHAVTVAKELEMTECFGVSTPSVVAHGEPEGDVELGAGEGKQMRRFVAILRDPTDRVRSWFSHFEPALDVNEWVVQELEDVQRGGGCDLDSQSAICHSVRTPTCMHCPQIVYARDFSLN